jgi:hypothetical protein
MEGVKLLGQLATVSISRAFDNIGQKKIHA